MSLINSLSLGLNSPSFLNPAAPQATGDPAFTKIYAFGDSLSDDGNLFTASLHNVPTSPPYDGGRFSNGPLWVEDLAQSLGLAHPSPSLQGGTDFAYGGAKTTGGGGILGAATPGDLPWQRIQYIAQNPSPQPNALYTLSIGSNDVLDAVGTNATNPQAANADITTAVNNEVSFVNELAHQGARNFMVLNVPDLGQTPQEIAKGSTVAQTASMLSADYDNQLKTQLGAVAAQDNLSLHIVDTYSLLDQAVANPAAFGFTNVTTPVWTGNYTNPNSGHLNATGAAQNSYLYFDQLHPTSAAGSVLASAAEQSLSQPALV